MKYLAIVLSLICAASVQAQAKFDQPPPIHNEKGVVCTPFNASHVRHPRGLKKTPRFKLFEVPRFKAVGTAPAQVMMLPKQLSMWGNDQYGDCVTAQECASKAAYSVYCGLPETFVTEATCISWARKYGFLNGADLPSVMNKMASVGITASDGKVYKDGPYYSVNFASESDLQSAIATGPVNIGMDANALPSGAGNQAGWYAFGGVPGQFNNEDHCCALFGYGKTADLFAAVAQVYGGSATPPANAPPTAYLYYTWSTVGIVDHAWLMSTMGEAYVRNPTTVGQSPQPSPSPNPTPNPTPTPSTGTVTIKISGQADQTFQFNVPASSSGVLTPDQFKALQDEIQKLQDMLKQSKMSSNSNEVKELTARIDALEKKINDDLSSLDKKVDTNRERTDKHLSDLIDAIKANQKVTETLLRESRNTLEKKPVPKNTDYYTASTVKQPALTPSPTYRHLSEISVPGYSKYDPSTMALLVVKAPDHLTVSMNGFIMKKPPTDPYYVVALLMKDNPNAKHTYRIAAGSNSRTVTLRRGQTTKVEF